MKNRKVFVGIALLIVVLVLGIGYAAITDTLEITGSATATADSKNFKVVFTGETTGVSDGVTAAATNGSVYATMNVTGLTTKGDSKSATFKIKNTSGELKALVDVATESITNTDFFAIDATVANPTAELAPNAETTVTVTVSLVKTPIDTVTGDINIELGATAVLGD